MKKRKLALFQSVISLLLCFSMLVGTTFAWFTDSVATGMNTIAAGNLDVELFHTNAAVTDQRVDSATKLFLDLQGDPILWEPGVVSYENLRVANEGDLALAYQLLINTAGENHVLDPESGAKYGLSQILKVGVVENGITANDRDGVVASVEDANWTTLADFIRSGSLLPEGAGESEKTWGIVIYWEPGEDDNRWNLNNGKELDQGEYLMIDLGIRLVATQEQFESDSFGSDYDANAKADVFPEFAGGTASSPVESDGNGGTAAEVTMSSGAVSATVPAGAKLAEGAKELTLSVAPMSASGANITLSDNEAMRSLDVHIEGLAADNTVPVTVTLTEAAPKGLNMGNYKLYHVEDGATVEMILVDSAADFTAHNQFKYDPATGDIVLYMATFSEVTVVAEPAKWEGNRDYSWYTNAVAPVDGEATADYVIANADQLAAFGAIVGGMDGQTQDSFAGKTVKLISDIDLGDGEEDNDSDLIFYPIGYYNSEETYEKTNTAITSGLENFEGTFDGQGHTISNFYQNTWEMKGDHNWYEPEDQHYRDGMGLFGKVYDGTVKNLTVDSFSSDGEFTPTGVIAAYADGDSTFENIAITNCNPRVYNTGNGGIIGIAGDTGAADDDHITLKNITVDNSNKISALWGSWDVACGGLVGMYRGNVDGSGNATGDTISFENCHVSAIIDVYNDVCANYQYYAYRYSGMIIGSVRHNTTNAEGKTIPNMTGISATGCTVNYGDWNDYYYCEFEKNTMASYSEDYQFSRVPHSELNFTDSNGNGEVDADERASVAGCKHTHTAEENHQAIYLPFHQLFTGYGWGVNSIGLEKYSGITVEDFSLGVEEDEEHFAPAVKFGCQFPTAKVDNETGVITTDFLYRVGTLNEVTAGTLFNELNDLTNPVSGSGVVVSVTSQHDDGINMGSFEAYTKDDDADGDVEWEKGKITFKQTGIAKVTIQDYDYCTPTVLYVEVVDAKNLTGVESSTNGTDVVFLNDVKISSGGTAHYQNCTVYGNGFTFDVSGGMNQYNSKQGHGIIIISNATLDHLRIEGDVYDEYGMYTSTLAGEAQNDYTAAVDATNSTIQNCYIANCATPIRSNGNTITDTTLYGGTVANLLISGGTNTLTNVTTVNYNDDRGVIGMGIVITDGASEDTTKLILNGYLKQHNYVYETDISQIKVEEAKTVFNSMFENQFSNYHIGANPKAVNTGIISINEAIDLDSAVFTDNANTEYLISNDVSVTFSAQSMSKTIGAAIASVGASGSVDNNYQNNGNVQGDYLPTFTFNLGEQMLAKDNDDDTCYLIGDANGLTAMYPQGESPLTLDLTKLATVTKYTNVSYPVEAKCVGPDGKEQTGTVTLDTKGTYKLVFTVNDNVFYDQNGDKIEYSVPRTYEVILKLDLYQKSIADATISISNTDLNGEYITSGVNKKYKMYPLQAISSIMDDANKDGTLESFDCKANIQSAVLTPEGNNAFSSPSTITVTYTGGQVLTFVLGTPSGLNSPGASYGGKTFSVKTDSSNGIYLQSDGAVASGSVATGTWPITSWSFKGTSGKVITNTTEVTINFTKPSCVTGDTLVTLADGTQKRIDQVTYEDKLLVWDFYTGEYNVAPASIVMNHGYGNYTVVTLKFSDGTTVNTINGHGFFDADENQFVILNETNAADYLGHEFVQVSADGYKTVKLVDYSVKTEYTESWSILTAEHFNCVLEGMFTLTPAEVEDSPAYLMPFEIGAGMKYDEVKMQADIEKYGLYTYADFAEYCTYDQFAAFGFKNLKVSVGKGYITWDEILYLLSIHIN